MWKMRKSASENFDYDVTNMPLFDSASLDDTRTDLSDAALRSALYASLPANTSVTRIVLLDKAAQQLGLAGVNRSLRSRLNKLLHTEAQAGRLHTNWDVVSRPQALPTLEMEH